MRDRVIEKVGLAVIIAGRLLVVRKHGSATFILPGGKPEPSETRLETLAREIFEELGCGVLEPYFLGSFADRAADASGGVNVHLYKGDLKGAPVAQAEIEELDWIDLHCAVSKPLAPSIMNQILPFLRNLTDSGPMRAMG